MTSPVPCQLDAALAYSKLFGWRVFPVNRDKTPKTAHGFKDASSDPEKIRAWWTADPEAGIAVATGAGLGVLDVDPRNGGEDGFATLTAGRALPETPLSLTGGGGRHYFFALPPGVAIPSKSGILPGVDWKADLGYIVIPRSLHPSGRRYEWEASSRPGKIEDFARLPDWLLKLILGPAGANGRKGPAPPLPGKLREGARHGHLASLAGTVRSRDFGEVEIYSALAAVNNCGRIDPPVEDDEIRRIAADYARKDAGACHRNGSAKASPDPADRPEKWPKPLGPAALSGITGDFVRLLAPHTEADPAALAIQFLVAVGGAIGRGSFQMADGSRHGLNEFAVLVGKSSRGRKGTSFDRTIEVLAGADSAWAADRVVMGGLSSGEGVIFHVRDAGEGDGESVDDKRLTVVESEFASVLRVLRREGNTLSPVLRNGWDGKTLRTLTKNSPLKATGAHLAVIGHITRDELLQNLEAVELSNGFANRFLFVLVKRSKELPEGGNPDLNALSALSTRLRKALDGAKGMGEMTRDLAAKALWRSEYPRLTREVPGLLGSVVSRAEAHVLRLSGIYAALEGTASISTDHLRAGLEVWRYSEESARCIFGDAVGDPVADEILALLREASAGLTREAIRDHFGGHKSSERLTRALQKLADAGLARMSPVPTAGRSAELWEAVREDA